MRKSVSLVSVIILGLVFFAFRSGQKAATEKETPALLAYHANLDLDKGNNELILPTSPSIDPVTGVIDHTGYTSISVGIDVTGLGEYDEVVATLYSGYEWLEEVVFYGYAGTDGNFALTVPVDENDPYVYLEVCCASGNINIAVSIEGDFKFDLSTSSGHTSIPL